MKIYSRLQPITLLPGILASFLAAPYGGGSGLVVGVDASFRPPSSSLTGITTKSSALLSLPLLAIPTLLNLKGVEAGDCLQQCKSANSDEVGGCPKGNKGTRVGGCCRKIDNDQCQAVSNPCDGNGSRVESNTSNGLPMTYEDKEGREFSVGCGSCIGPKSCTKSPGATIGTNSCIGLLASMQDGVCGDSPGITVGDGSCIGDKSDACAKNGYSEIGDNSCHGYQACSLSDNSVIADNSCHGTWACYTMTGHFTEGPISQRIGPSACRGDSSCSLVYQSKYDFVTNTDGKCSNGQEPKYDFPENVCVGGESMCRWCGYYLGCVEPGRCNADLSPGDVLSDPKGWSRCKLCHVSCCVIVCCLFSCNRRS